MSAAIDSDTIEPERSVQELDLKLVSTPMPA